MLRFTLQEAARLALGLLGAILIAAAVAALAEPGARMAIWPFLIAVGRALNGYAHLDLGTSAISAQPVLDELSRTLPWTLVLVTAGLVIAVGLGVPLGLLFGAGPVRRAAAPLMQIVAAAPVFCAGLALAWLAVNVFRWPIAMAGGAGVALADFTRDPETLDRAFKVALLPALTVGAAGAASVQHSLRRAAAEVSKAPYRVGLHRMGLAQLEIERVYVLPDVLAALLGSLGELTLALFAASAIAEWVFNCPGAAVLFVKSVALQDWAMAASVLLTFAAIKLIADFIGTVGARALADPGPAA